MKNLLIKTIAIFKKLAPKVVIGLLFILKNKMAKDNWIKLKNEIEKIIGDKK